MTADVQGIEPTGQLELTWTNKNLRLLSDSAGGYEWTVPGDYRVAEVRLLHEVTPVGETGPRSARASDNLLIRGDALHALTALTALPEFAAEYLGKIRLVYIDPPFNTGQAFANYNDDLEHSVWLTMMRDRLRQIHDLLADNGSVWVHLDDVEMAHCRVLMDEIFGRDCFVTSFVWRKVDSPNDNKVTVTPDHEYILCYTKRPGGTASWQRLAAEGILAAYGQVNEEGRRYRDRLLRKNGKNSLREDRPTMWFPITSPEGDDIYPIHDDGREANWSLGAKRVRELQLNDELIWKQRPAGDGSSDLKWVPYTREWAPDVPTRPWPTIWTDVDTSRQAKKHLTDLFPGTTPFATPKPERLMSRVIEIATVESDIVLDCFVGSGTTAAVAHKLGRRWVAVERSHDTLETFTLPRLEKVVAGEDPGGITELSGWEGGGGFRVLDVAASMFTVFDSRVVLAEWAAGGALAECVAAQYGFVYDDTDPPFAGRKGSKRLAVVDGLVNEDVLDLLLGWLGKKEILAVYGTGVDPACHAVLSKRRRGSVVKRIPQAVLDDYRGRTATVGGRLDWPSLAAATPETAA